MSLRHALLAVLVVEPMTGYELVKYFDGSIAFLWSAPHSQIYPELRRMEAAGLLEAEVVPRGVRAEKRVYSITTDGRAELLRWAADPMPHHTERNPHRLRAALFEWSSLPAARRHLREHIHHHRGALAKWERISEDIESGRVPLLNRRLSHRPGNEQAALVAIKRFAFRGEMARARAEIAWAQEGLALLDELERTGVALYGDAADGAPGGGDPADGGPDGGASAVPASAAGREQG